MNIKTVLLSLTFIVLASAVQTNVHAKEIKIIETDEADIEVRVFP